MFLNILTAIKCLPASCMLLFALVMLSGRLNGSQEMFQVGTLGFGVSSILTLVVFVVDHRKTRR